VTHLITGHGLPVQRACQAVGLARGTYYRPLVDWARRDAPVIAALTTLVAAKSRWGFWKCCDRLQLDGHPWNHKRLWRVYCQLRLNLPRRTKKRLPGRFRQPLVVVPQPNVVWAVDFMSDTLYGGRRFRALNILDEGVREGLAIEVDTSLPAARVVRVLEQVVAWRGQPKAIRLDNGPEFIAECFMSWCAARAIELWHSNRGSRIRMPSSSGIIGPTERKCAMPMCLSHWIRCVKSVPNGCRATTKNGLMRRWRGCHPPRIGPTLKPEVLH
jgi:putative transposase